MMVGKLMPKDEHAVSTRHDRAFLGACALLFTAVACTVVVLATPRMVEPLNLPALRLDAGKVKRQLQEDAALSAEAPRGADVDRLLKLYRAEGIDELAPHVDGGRLAERRAELSIVAREVAARVGERGLRAVREATLERALKALQGELELREAQSLLGRFPALLEQYGFVDSEGRLRAPLIAVRAFYKTRFNDICQRMRTQDLSEIERQALEGFMALHASGVAGLRANAARAFRDAGGADASEALAVWLYHTGQSTAARTLLRRAYEQTGALRLRNMALFLDQ